MRSMGARYDIQGVHEWDSDDTKVDTGEGVTEVRRRARQSEMQWLDQKGSPCRTTGCAIKDEFSTKVLLAQPLPIAVAPRPLQTEELPQPLYRSNSNINSSYYSVLHYSINSIRDKFFFWG